MKIPGLAPCLQLRVPLQPVSGASGKPLSPWQGRATRRGGSHFGAAHLCGAGGHQSRRGDLLEVPGSGQLPVPCVGSGHAGPWRQRRAQAALLPLRAWFVSLRRGAGS